VLKLGIFFCVLFLNNEWCVLDTRYIKMFILDEADEMLSRGFKDQIYDVFRTLNENIQVIGTNRCQYCFFCWLLSSFQVVWSLILS